MPATAPSPERSRAFSDPTAADRYRTHLLRQVFEPWAAELVGRAQLEAGQAVLDVACGLGPVARRAAAVVGPGGAVTGADISPSMLAGARAFDPAPGSAPITYVECPADHLGGADGRFDAITCQQGLQFFPDAHGALVEMRRVVRAGGTLAVACWTAAHPMPMFEGIRETLREMGEAEPYPGALRQGSYNFGHDELGEVVAGAGWLDVTVEPVDVDATWSDVRAMLDAVHGTPFGPLVAAMDAARAAEFRRVLAARLGLDEGAAGPVAVTTTATVAVGAA
jgi:ubiquinone/menaquinone biosynthesis C-methylase UbiE